VTVPVGRNDAGRKSVGVAKPVHPTVQFEQLGFEIVGGQQIPVDRMRRLGHVETRGRETCLGWHVVVLRVELIAHGGIAHIPMAAAVDGAAC